MSDSMLRRGPLVLGIGLLAVIVATVAWEPRSGGAGFWYFVGIGGAVSLLWIGVGSLIASRHRSNPVGWLVLTLGLAFGVWGLVNTIGGVLAIRLPDERIGCLHLLVGGHPLRRDRSPSLRLLPVPGRAPALLPMEGGHLGRGGRGSPRLRRRGPHAGSGPQQPRGPRTQRPQPGRDPRARERRRGHQQHGCHPVPAHRHPERDLAWAPLSAVDRRRAAADPVARLRRWHRRGPRARVRAHPDPGSGS